MAYPHDGHVHDTCCIKDNNSSVRQTLEEMEFERGIWYAAQNDDLTRVETLLRNGASSVDKEDSAGYTALHYAARNAHYRVCETLLRHGADVNARTRCGRATALHRAAMHGHADIVRLLLRHGADANLTDADGNTALHRALAISSSYVCELLIPHTTLTTVTSHLGRNVEQSARQNCNEILPIIATCTNQAEKEKENFE